MSVKCHMISPLRGKRESNDEAHFSNYQLIGLIFGFLVLVLTVGECIVLPLSCNYMAKIDCKLFVWNKQLFNAAMHVVI